MDLAFRGYNVDSDRGHILLSLRFVVVGGAFRPNRSRLKPLLHEVLGILDGFFDRANHVKRLLRKVIVITGNDAVKATDRVCQ